MKKINLKNLFSRKVGNKVPLKIGRNYFARDWKIILLFFLVGLIFVSVFAWYIYLGDKIAGGFYAPVTDNTNLSIKVISLDRIKADILLLDIKQMDYQKIKINRPQMVDPAL